MMFIRPQLKSEISDSKTYWVVKFTHQCSDLGHLPGEDVKRLLKGYSYDDRYEMWYSPRGTIGYDVKEDN